MSNETRLESLFACRGDGRVAKALIRDRDRPRLEEQLGHESRGDMAWAHLDEDLRPQFAQDFEGPVPTDRMRDARREVPADGLGIPEGAAAPVAHEGHRR